MKYRANHQQNQHNLELHKIYLDNLLELEIEQQKQQKIIKSNNPLTTNSSSTNMKHKQSCSSNAQISGLNNLGNSCFFNAILQNLAQTPHLEELLRENSTSQEKLFVIKHNDDYDSELTDFDDDESTNNINNSNKSEDKNDQVDSDLKETTSEFDLINNKKESDNSTNKVHRSMRLNDLSLLLKEQSGATPGSSFLGKQLADLVKNMNNSTGTVNPSALFGSVCKKIPAFKGFHQQDSHELLRNLLDAIKTEELKRRQAALLETFRVSKPNTLDDKLKIKIKRYGRLASYTHIDKLFGGHLLSSIVCEECTTCIQRVEPFLDLSLPISTGVQAASVAIDDQPSDDYKRRTTRNSKRNLKNTATSPTITPNSEEPKQLSKHMNKKQQKKAAKNAKKLRKQVKEKESQNEENYLKEENKEQSNETNDTNLDLIQAVNKLNLEDETNKEDLSSNEAETELNSPNNDKETEQNKEVEVNLSDNEDELTKQEDSNFKLENSFKLEAMKTIKQNQQSVESESITLQACLSKFTSNEILSDKIKCENCTRKNHKINTYTKALKQYLICELPAILTIHLKRFQQHGYRLEKSNKHVQFPLVLDMSSYTSKMCININGEQRNQMEPVLYSLYGLVEHSGRLNSGHYTAYVKSNHTKSRPRSSLFLGNQRLCHLNMMLKKWNGQSIVDTNNNLEERGDVLNKDDLNSSSSGATGLSEDVGADLDDQWFYISDSHVTEVNVSRVLKAQAYILFYERIE